MSEDVSAVETVKVYGGVRQAAREVPASAVKEWLAAETAEWTGRALPGMVSLEIGERVLEVVVGNPRASLVVWHKGFDEIAWSRGTIEAPDDWAYDYGGHRTTPYDDAAVPPTVAAEAVTEFIASGGARPTVLEWQEPEDAR
ncbi:Imm1 family immunity protein [Phytomonospora sp. NPDC050363]|uniref:Imm1 family immunity protein n=1 Tax=Phytomonospora sp. NPDC050363 TaxID=3155642 RepID=UPI0033DDF534